MFLGHRSLLCMVTQAKFLNSNPEKHAQGVAAA